jgi:pSer/pThr/pTyr-binding forkhead associated (FHA) protein
MRAPRLAVDIQSPLNGMLVRRELVSLPCMVGRSHINGVRLCANTVSRYHGVFLLWAGTPRYVDFGSSNGTKIDGARIEPDVPVAFRDHGVIEIGPFQLTVDVDGAGGEEGEEVTEVPATPEQGAALRVSGRRAAEVTALLAELFARYLIARSGMAVAHDPIAEEILWYLTEPDAPSRLDELRASLIEIFERWEETCSHERLH